MEDDVPIRRPSGEVEIVVVEVRNITGRIVLSIDVHRVVTGGQHTEVAAINRPFDRAAVDGDGIVIRRPVLRHAASDEAVHGRASADRNVVRRGISFHAIRADGAASHLAIDVQGVARQLRRIRIALRQSGDGALVGGFACADRDLVPRVFRRILDNNDVFVGIIDVVPEGFCFRDREDESIIDGILCHGALDGTVDAGQVDGICDVRSNQLAAPPFS